MSYDPRSASLPVFWNANSMSFMCSSRHSVRTFASDNTKTTNVVNYTMHSWPEPILGFIVFVAANAHICELYVILSTWSFSYQFVRKLPEAYKNSKHMWIGLFSAMSAMQLVEKKTNFHYSTIPAQTVRASVKDFLSAKWWEPFLPQMRFEVNGDDNVIRLITFGLSVAQLWFGTLHASFVGKKFPFQVREP